MATRNLRSVPLISLRATLNRLVIIVKAIFRDAVIFDLFAAGASIVRDLTADATIVIIGVVLPLVLLVEDVHEVESGVACEVDDSLLALIVDEAEDLEIAEHRELDGLLEQTFLPLAVSDLAVAQVRNQLDLIQASFVA